MHVSVSDLNQMLIGKHPTLQFIKYVSRQSGDFPFFAVFLHNGKYYGAGCQGKPVEKGDFWEDVIADQVVCIELHRALKMENVFVTVDDLYNPALGLIPLDLPFKKPAN